MQIDNNYIRSQLRQVYVPDDIFGHENVFLLDESGALIGLNLSNSDIVDLAEISALKYLRFLDLSDNSIADAKALRHLAFLEKIDLAFNQIDDLSFVHHLPKLNYLDVRSNRVSRLPSSFANLPMPIKWHYVFQHRGIFLEGNPLEAPPPEVVLRGEADLRAYLSSMEGGTIPLREFKAIVLGGGRAGKTSLVRKLAGDSFRSDEEVTRGVNLRAVQGPIGDIKGHFWDFGGQEFMYATHSCFLTRRAVYLVVLDGRREEKAEDWLKLIQIVGPASPVFILINKIDENPRYDLNRGELCRKWPNVEGIFPISCSTGEGLEPFVERFWRRVGDFDLPRMEFSPQWVKAKEFLLAHREPLVSCEFCLSACAANGVTEHDQQSALLNCLHDLGLIIHFTGHGLGAFIVLHPPWLTNAMYAVLDDAFVKDRSGFLSWSDVERILAHLDTSVPYTPEARRFTIDVMSAFEVSFPVDADRLLIPDLLPRHEPATLPTFNEARCEMMLGFDFLPISVFHRCIVRLREDIQYDCLWLTGAVFQHEQLNARAMVTFDQSSSKVQIVVDGPRRRDYLTVIRHAISNAVRTSGRVAYTEYVRLPTAQELYVAYPELLGLKRMKVHQYFHGVSGQVFSVDALLAQVEALDGRVSPEPSSQTDSSVPEVPKKYAFVAYARQDRPFVDRLSERLRMVGVQVWYDVSINAGASFAQEIEHRILNCSALIIVVSPEAHESTFIRNEIALATEHNKPLLPIQLRKVDRWIEIAGRQWLFADDETWFAELFKSLVTFL